MKKEKILATAAATIMLAPAALNALPTNIVQAAAVGTISSTTPTYNSKGQSTGRTLPTGSQWQLGQQVTLNGIVNYQVATNEFVPASAVTNVTGPTNSEDDTHTVGRYVSDNADAGKTVRANQTLNVVDVYGNETGRTLPANSQWKIGQLLHVNKTLYYQVGGNEYVPVVDVTLFGATENNTGSDFTQDGNFGKTVTVKAAQPLVDNNGLSLGITLPVGSQWKIGKLMRQGNVDYYQVATNEWVPVSAINIQNTQVGSNNGSYITSGNTMAGKIGTVVSDNVPVVNGAGVATGRTLAKGSQWKVGSQNLHYDKQAFFQISTNEYVSDMYLSVETGNTTSSVPTPGNGLVATLTKTQQVYDPSTNTYGQTLAANTAWRVNQLVVNKYGSFWGRIAPNQWVWISNTTLNSGLNLKANSYYEPEFATNINK